MKRPFLVPQASFSLSPLMGMNMLTRVIDHYRRHVGGEFGWLTFVPLHGRKDGGELRWTLANDAFANSYIDATTTTVSYSFEAAAVFLVFSTLFSRSPLRLPSAAPARVRAATSILFPPSSLLFPGSPSSPHIVPIFRESMGGLTGSRSVDGEEGLAAVVVVAPAATMTTTTVVP
jgi:hypothetical protein